MVFVLGITRIKNGFEAEIFHTDIADASRPVIFLHRSAAKILIDGRRYRRIHRNAVALNGPDDALPQDVAAAGFPTATFAATKVRCAKLINPGLGAGADDSDRVAHFQTTSVFEVKTRRANRNVIIRDRPGLFGAARKDVLSGNADERAAIQTGSDKNRSIFAHPLAAQNNAGVSDLQAAKNLMPALEQQHRTANAVRTSRPTGNVINRTLDARGFIALDG